MPLAHGLLWLCVSFFLAGCGSSSSRHLGANVPPGSGNGPPLPPPPGGGFPPPPGPPPASVTVSGTVTFDRVPFDMVLGNGLDFDATQPAPARGVTVEAVSPTNNSVLAVTRTDAAGAYSLTLLPNASVFLRVKAEMASAGPPTWTFRVRDNTSADALYALIGGEFDTGITNSTRDLHAASGWDSGSGSYPNSALRAAGPFAILDAIYDAQQLVVSADPQVVFPPLDVFWSPANRPAIGTGNPLVDIPNGDIETTFFETGTPAKIYVLGSADEDTDEFDSHVITHEWGHYYQFAFSRDDSVGGSHDPSERLDFRVAFSEGWGDAFSGMALQDPIYRDSFDVDQGSDFGADMEAGVSPAPGWFNEGSIALLLYDLFDGMDAEAESVQVGFGSLHGAMGALQTTDALTSIHPFVNALVPLVPPANVAAIQALITAQSIVGVQPDDFAALETNNGGDADNLPIYTLIGVGDTRQVCSTGAPGQSYNKLGNRSFLRFTLATAYSGSIAVSTPDPVSDPDVVLYLQGVELARGEGPAEESLLVNLAAGTYVIETYESSNVFGDFVNPPPFGNVCIEVAIAP